jgi:hypothetical protein
MSYFFNFFPFLKNAHKRSKTLFLEAQKRYFTRINAQKCLFYEQEGAKMFMNFGVLRPGLLGYMNEFKIWKMEMNSFNREELKI